MKNSFRKYFRLGSFPLACVLIIGIMLLHTTCRINYSFTGASISPKVKSVSIQYFPNQAPLVVPTLSGALTDALRDYFTSQTNLILINRDGDLNIEGAITGYAVQPVAIQGNETAAMNRLSITVNVKFTNKTNEKQNFETSFSRYQDYQSALSLVSVQDELIKQINDQLVQDIFNKAVVNW